jgi:peptidoglycan/LPS O-acetylase OafA/YrhL
VSTEKRLEAPGRIPSLDGIRAVAISINIFGHVVARYSWPPQNGFFHKILGHSSSSFWGGDGVGIFFVLSGFLITTLLFQEYEKTQTIRLGHFYIRRCFRILPPLYVFLLFALIYCLVKPVPFTAQDFLSPVLFYRDYYFHAPLWIVENLWTLSVEEQFYLLWPLLMLFTLRYKGRSAAAKLCVVLLLLAPVLRVAGNAFHIGYTRNHIPWMFHTRMDSLMAGCLLALCVGLPRFEAFYQRYAKYWWILPIYYWGISYYLDVRFFPKYTFTIGYTLDALATAFFIVWASRNADSFVGKILNSRLFVTMGVLSYSAYLWQTFFTNKENTSFLGVMPWALVSIWICAWLSYHFIELPSLNLRKKLLSRRKQAVVPQPA